MGYRQELIADFANRSAACYRYGEFTIRYQLALWPPACDFLRTLASAINKNADYHRKLLNYSHFLAKIERNDKKSCPRPHGHSNFLDDLLFGRAAIVVDFGLQLN
ncbi:hypothetical protein TcasGA2_TC015694 [Tribolium castaneum]|uniref:Uncharacterized protein n=1 Tax=Tribolium castaneum TaxID=7070 RepID=D2A6G1_TRICA|nr:hypothetical protein TcasGA2_TC015694 [Tribolium castaneum]